MSRFTTRVELYGNPSHETYTALHEAMAKQGFSRQVTLDDHVTYWLPNAEYTLEGTRTAAQVKDVAKLAAATVWKNFGIMVTATEVPREFHNLNKA